MQEENKGAKNSQKKPTDEQNEVTIEGPRCENCGNQTFSVLVRKDSDTTDSGNRWSQEYHYCTKCGEQHLRAAVYRGDLPHPRQVKASEEEEEEELFEDQRTGLEKFMEGKGIPSRYNMEATPQDEQEAD